MFKKHDIFKEMNIGIKDFLSWYSVNNFLQFDVLHIKNRYLVWEIFQFC